MTSIESNYSEAVEVNGVSFRAEIQSVIPIPKLPGGKTPVRLGIRAKNNRSTRLYFERLKSLEPIPMLIDPSGNEVDFSSDLLKLWVKGKPYYSVEPGEEVLFALESVLSRGYIKPHEAWSVFKLRLKIYSESGGFLYFCDLKPGTYRLQLSYRNSGPMYSVPLEEQSLGTGWAGTVTLPFVSFRLGSWTLERKLRFSSAKAGWSKQTTLVRLHNVI